VGRKYRNPPVVEALCEVFFAGSSWDDTIPGRFYDQVKDAFPERRQQEMHEAALSFTPSGGAKAGIRKLAPRMRFVSKPGDRLIQLGRDLLVVNQLRPYPRFEKWAPIMESALKNYEDLCQPQSVARLGVRYINRVEIPAGRVRMEDYFTVYPTLPALMGDTHGAFLVRFEVSGQKAGHIVMVTFATAPVEKPDTLAFLLDLYDIFQPDPGIAIGQVQDEVKTAHDCVEAAFEGSITDRLRALFEEENSW
jgi:uncharacterized protein (TIGR04255 family)